MNNREDNSYEVNWCVVFAGRPQYPYYYCGWQGSNLQPSGYEPDALTDCATSASLNIMIAYFGEKVNLMFLIKFENVFNQINDYI